MAALSVLLAGPALACPEFGHPKLASGPSIDLGAGLVAQSQARTGRVVGSEDLFGEEIYLVHDCDAGPSLWLHTYREEPRGEVLYDRKEAAAGLVNAVQADRRLHSLAAIVAGAEARDIEVREIGAVGIETCLCAEVYPELRGEKVPYEEVK